MSTNMPQTPQDDIHSDEDRTTHSNKSLDVAHDHANGPGLQLALTSRAAFWAPRHVHTSPNLKNLPYLFWLIEACRPNKVLQLGLTDAVLFMGLCQAIDQIRLEASCIGVPHDGAQANLPAQLSEAHASHYGHFSAIERQPDLERPPHPDIDLLVIDCPLIASTLTALLDHWLPRLTARGVVIVLFPHSQSTGVEGLEFLNSLQSNHTTLKIPGAPDSPLTVLYGSTQSDRLLCLSQLSRNSPDDLALLQVFQRLGQSIEQTAIAKNLSAALQITQAKVEKVTETLDQREQEIAKLRKEARSLQTNESAQAELLSVLQARFADVLEVRQQEHAELQERIVDIAVLTQDYERKLKALNIKCVRAETRNKALEHSLSWKVTAPLRKLNKLLRNINN